MRASAAAFGLLALGGEQQLGAHRGVGLGRREAAVEPGAGPLEELEERLLLGDGLRPRRARPWSPPGSGGPRAPPGSG